MPILLLNYNALAPSLKKCAIWILILQLILVSCMYVFSVRTQRFSKTNFNHINTYQALTWTTLYVWPDHV